MPASEPTWTVERVELLNIHYEAGLSCSEIAREIGVSRNAVIGKISRLGLSRIKSVSRQYSERNSRLKAGRPRVVSQHRILMALHSKPQSLAEEVPIHNGHRCSLLELSEEKCRWPIGNPRTSDFLFCGNEPVSNLPYCAGHARIAYQLPTRQHRAR
jgi:GcrA cell cycle regulator